MYISELSLKRANYGSHTLGACKNRTITFPLTLLASRFSFWTSLQNPYRNFFCGGCFLRIFILQYPSSCGKCLGCLLVFFYTTACLQSTLLLAYILHYCLLTFYTTACLYSSTLQMSFLNYRIGIAIISTLFHCLRAHA